MIWAICWRAPSNRRETRSSDVHRTALHHPRGDRELQSIAACDVPLGPLTFLVGRNGSGKSNFLDALRFVADALRGGLDAALRARGNVDDLRHRGAAPDAPLGLHVDLALPFGDRSLVGHYTLRLARRAAGAYVIAEERCMVEQPGSEHHWSGFHVRDGQVLQSLNGAREISTDRLFLPVSNTKLDRLVYDVLAAMAFYQPNPAQMRSPHPHEPGTLLVPDASNVASVLLRLAQREPAAMRRITEYLHAVLPMLQAVRATPIGGYDTLQFYQQRGEYDPLQFYQVDVPAPLERPFDAAAMSDGTLHALGVLVALFQGGFGELRKPAVIGIEEPETALHPAATAVLRDAFRTPPSCRRCWSPRRAPICWTTKMCRPRRSWPSSLPPAPRASARSVPGNNRSSAITWPRPASCCARATSNRPSPGSRGAGRERARHRLHRGRRGR